MYVCAIFLKFIFDTYIYQEPRSAQADFSSETEPTLWKAIPVLECMLNRWQVLSEATKFTLLQHAILKGIEKLEKWYLNIKETETYFTCIGS